VDRDIEWAGKAGAYRELGRSKIRRSQECSSLKIP
jgi:hypothetical protein